ncbi:hypothetical protein [Halodesulfovibrio aestuarii]|uniref:hypothetical protein n=1 Tax=Halodesulfovibrio aestuarii TaxID=126333 RepID=UPI00040836A5
MIQEAKLYLYIHPVIQLLGTIFGYFALLWGLKRFLIAHGNMKLVFPWKQHVLYGKIATSLWLVGLAFGVYFTREEWQYCRITGAHYTLGVIAFLFVLGTFLTGYWMELFKKKRVYLSVTHGLLGVLLCILVFLQIVTGVQVLSLFLW